MNSQDDEHEPFEPAIQGTTADLKSFAVDLPLADSGINTASHATVTSSQNPLSVFTVQTQNGQVYIQQPGNNVTNNGPTAVHNNGATIPKGHIIVRQKPEPGTVLSTQSLPGRTEKTFLEKAGVKRPLITSAPGNVITKVIITKNPVSGQAQPFPAGSMSQTLTLTSLPTSSNVNLNTMGTVVKHVDSSVLQPGSPTKTVTITSQGILSPVKTVIATIPGTGSARFSIPIHKIPISPAKTPTKITMIPASKSPSKQSVSDNITVLSRALNSLAQSGNVTINPGSPSKVIIKQGPPPSGTAITLKAQNLPTLAPQSSNKTQATVHTVRAPQIAQGIRPIATISSAGTVQPVQVSGNKFHYVRLVSPAIQSQASSVTVTKTVAVAQTVQSAKSATVVHASESSSISQPKQMKITIPVQQTATLAPKPVAVPASNVNVAVGQSSVQRILLPATSTSTNTQTSTISSLAPIQPAPTNPVTQLPLGTTILTAGNNNNLQGFALVPASYVTQLQQQLSKPVQAQVANLQPPSRQMRDYVPIASINPAVTQYTVSRNTPSQNGPTLEATGSRPRKPCNCTKSQCLKLYCDCFANGEFCQNCNCTNCANNLEHEEERSKAIKSCLERNPHAFHPKIGKAKDIEGNRRHNKGCNCKRSGCLKNYCECYEAKIMCSNFCKCVGCKNFEESPDRKTLMHLADAAEVRVQQQTAAKTKLSSQISCVPSRPPANTAGGERLPFAFITADVAEATSACLLAQAEEAERMRMPPVVQERMIIEEFGRCLMQIIESANRTRTANSLA